MPLVQDRSLDLLISSLAHYQCAAGAPKMKYRNVNCEEKGLQKETYQYIKRLYSNFITTLDANWYNTVGKVTISIHLDY